MKNNNKSVVPLLLYKQKRGQNLNTGPKTISGRLLKA
jgi:hypothetical protein